MILPIGAITVCLCLLLAAFLLTVEGPLKPANRFLAGFLALTAVDTAGWAAGLIPLPYRDLFFFRMPLAYLQMPLLYAYARALCFPGSPSRPHWRAGLGMAVLSAASLVPRFQGWFTQPAALPGALPGTFLSREMDLAANHLLLHVQFYVYLGLMIRVLRQYRLAYQAFHSNPAPWTRVWLSTVIWVSGGAHTLVLVKSLARFAGRGETSPSLDPALELLVGTVAVAITCALTLTALIRQELFLGIPLEPPQETSEELAPAPPQAFGDEAVDRPGDGPALRRLQSFLATEEPFLDPSLNIRSLARRLGMGQRDLSCLINQQLGLHFFDFINQYRVAKAAAMLSDPGQRHLTILQIAHLSGFNTKSSFNAAFSKHLGITPSRLRQQAAALCEEDGFRRPEG